MPKKKDKAKVKDLGRGGKQLTLEASFFARGSAVESKGSKRESAAESKTSIQTKRAKLTDERATISIEDSSSSDDNVPLCHKRQPAASGSLSAPQVAAAAASSDLRSACNVAAAASSSDSRAASHVAAEAAAAASSLRSALHVAATAASGCRTVSHQTQGAALASDSGSPGVSGGGSNVMRLNLELAEPSDRAKIGGVGQSGEGGAGQAMATSYKEQKRPQEALAMDTCMSKGGERDNMSQAWTNLQELFKLRSFRPLQREAIERVLAGKDVVVCLATGGGTSRSRHNARA